MQTKCMSDYNNYNEIIEGLIKIKLLVTLGERNNAPCFDFWLICQSVCLCVRVCMRSCVHVFMCAYARMCVCVFVYVGIIIVQKVSISLQCILSRQ